MHYMEQEILQRAMVMRQQSEEIERQLEFIKEQIYELEKFAESLQALRDSKETEILAPLGKGVYVKSERKEDTFFVEVGAGVVVKKSLEDTKRVIDNQIDKFSKVKVHLLEQLEAFATQFRAMLTEVQHLRGDHNHG